LLYDSSIGNDFRTAYAYDEVSRYNDMPYCSDLMVRFYARSAESAGRLGIALSKYQSNYRAWVDLTGEMVIAKTAEGKETILKKKSITPATINRPTLVKFANIDHQLIFQLGGENLTYDLGRSADDAGSIKEDIVPQVKIFGAGQLTLSHVAIFRDIHYTETDGPNRAAKGNPLTLAEDEFFVLGDNSPNSEDGRRWSQRGLGINGQRVYREGIVPRDYLVGKALFVYWPSGFRPFAKSPFAIIPNVGQMRFIYGGSR